MLVSRLSGHCLRDTVKTLNNYYTEAEKIGGQSYLEGCLACSTAYLIFLCMETRYEKVRLGEVSYWPRITWVDNLVPFVLSFSHVNLPL